MKQRGLVELARGGNLRQQIEGWGGGVEVQGEDAVLVFDDGLGGFLPLSAADLSCDPLSLASAGIVPAPGSLMVMADGVCMVKQTQRALYRHWQLAEGEAAPVRALLARAARLATEIALGRGEAGHLVALDDLALDMATQGWRPPGRWAVRCVTGAGNGKAMSAASPAPRGCASQRRAAPCHSTCPANIDIPSFMAHLGHGDYRATIEVIRRDNPLPLTCGLVCPAPCESACVRGGKDGAVFIRPLKAKAAEHCLADGGYPRPEIAPDSGKRIGIVGSGPASLTAAYYLRTHGHQVEVFEAQEKAGGMLRYGIPAYRMPPELLDQEIAQIEVLGIPIRTGAKVASLEQFRKDYDAVFIGLGTQTSRMLPIEGVHQPFVLGGIDFLRAVRAGEKVRVGPRVVVIGGGNVAIDVALTALRQGASAGRPGLAREAPRDAGQPATRSKARSPRACSCARAGARCASRQDGDAVFQFCESVKDESGKFNPTFDTGRLLTLEVDHVLLATGQGTDLAILEGSAVENTRGFVVADPKTKMTTVPGVFAGGDAQHGPRTVVEAIRSGKIAAASIDAWLRGVPPDATTGTPVRRADVAPLAHRRAGPHPSGPRRDAREERRGGRSARATTSASSRA